MARDDFVNLHVHSHFSTLDGLSTPQEIVSRAVDLGQRAIAVTDHGSMSGIPQMYQAARDADITLVPGCEMYFSTDRFHKGVDRLGEKYYHLILLATNNTGYKNLSKLQTIAWEDGYYYKPRCDYEALERYNEGLIVTTSCLGGIVNQHLLRGDVAAAEEELGVFVDIFGKERTYVELQNHGIAEQLKILGAQRDLANKFGLKMIATTDSHYCTHEESDVHDSLLCTGTKATKDQEKRFRFGSDQHFIHSAEQMTRLFPPREFPGAVSNTVEIAEQTDFTMNMGEGKKYLMPITGTPDGKTDDEVLREKVYSGAAEMSRYGDSEGNIPDDVKERIDYELSIIASMKFSSYFLIVQNLIELFNKNGIHTGPGRGCLAPDTPVKTPTGFVPISDISPGDEVITAQGEVATVAKTPTHGVADGEHMVKITTDNGSSIELTEKHKVLLYRAQGIVWAPAHTVSPGDVMIDIRGHDDDHDHGCHHGVTPYGFPADTFCEDTGITVSDCQPVMVVESQYVSPNYTTVHDLVIDAPHHPSFITSSGVVHNSAPGSVVVYCLGIVNVDPMEHNLFFERFLNPDRISMPDIDVDIPKTKRQEALQLVEQEYGKGHVAHMSNYNKMGMRDAIVRAAKVYGMAPGAANKFRDMIATWCEDYGVSIHDFAHRGAPPEEIAEKLPHTDHYNDIVRTASKFVGRMMGNGVHASGVLITDTPLDDNFPIRVAKGSVIPVCQYDGTDTESIGGVKFDLLGLINLDECEDTERNILLDLGEEVDSTNIAYDDHAVFDMLSQGHGGGVFQFGCLAGNTPIGGTDLTIEEMYKLRNSARRVNHTPSLFMGTGMVTDHTIKQVVYSGIKDTIVVGTDSGNTIQCTPDHKLWTLRGWVPAGELDSTKDYVMSWDSTKDTMGVRGREDIVEAFLSVHTGWLSRPRSRVSFGNVSCRPDVISPCGDYYAYFYPDQHKKSGRKLADSVKHLTDDKGQPYLRVLSYSEAMEEVCHTGGASTQSDLLLPVGCTWDKVTSIDPGGQTKTYDIMMDDPVHNFIAGGIVTHNSSGMQSLLRHMNPSEFKHIVASLALYRPGPMGEGTHDEYCERRLGRSQRDVLHPDMKNYLADTYDLIVYQEDIMSIARGMAGYTGGEADDLRKAMAKKDPAMMDKHKKKFIPAVNKSYGGNLGNKLWDIIEPFGAYAFNKCVTGDTGIHLIDSQGNQVDYTIEQLYNHYHTAVFSDGADGVVTMVHDNHYTLCVDPHNHDTVLPTRIVDVHYNGSSQVFRVETQGGREITTTASHRFVTPDGYVRLEDLSEGKQLCVVVGGVASTDTIVSITPAGIEEVYDVEVEDPYHNWTTNQGIVTHNSHSVAYGVLSYRTAWLKAHYPAQFAGAVMDHNLSSHDKIFDTVSWIKKTKVGIQPPNIQRSEMRSVTTDSDIALPLHIIRGVGDKKAESIIEERTTGGPFESVVDAVARCKLPKSMVINMAKAGAFDCLGADRAAVIKNIDAIMSLAGAHKAVMTMSTGLFGGVIESNFQDDNIDLSTTPESVIDGDEVVVVDDRTRGQWERDMMGVLLGKHPFESIRESHHPGAKKLLHSYPPVDCYTKDTKNARMTGMIHNMEHRTSQRGAPYTTFVLETDVTSVPAMVFKKHLPETVEGRFVAITGSIEDDSGDFGNTDGGFTPKVFCDSIRPIDTNKLFVKE